MDSAVAGCGLYPVFQPIVSLPDGVTVGFEALARWSQLRDTPPEEVFTQAIALGQEQQLEQMSSMRRSRMRCAPARGYGRRYLSIASPPPRTSTESTTKSWPAEPRTCS
jgi:hypothetical protein